jgi:hypothetical protein
MWPVYEDLPLTPSRDEVRVITIFPEDDSHGNLRCKMERVSLLDITPEYRDFLAVHTQETNPSKRLSSWCSHMASDHDILEGEIEALKFPEKHHHRFKWGDFAALSYMWGNPSLTTTIKVNNVLMRVTLNLKNALLMLRAQNFDTKFKVWIDALCINQSDMDEKPIQVSKMADMYSLSWSVIAYLGEQVHESDKAIALIESLAEYHGSHEKGQALWEILSANPSHFGKGSWLALNHFTTRPYWMRLWIVQELALGSSRTIVFCGKQSIDWQRLCYGLEVIHVHLWIIKDKCIELDRKAVDPYDESGWYDPEPLSHISKDLWALSKPSSQRSLTINRMLEMIVATKTSDPRDKIYGMLGLMPLELSQRIFPDYRISIVEVLINAASAYIAAYRDLELLHDANTWGCKEAPSWAPDWTWGGRPRDSKIDVTEDHARIWYPGFKYEYIKAFAYTADRGLRYHEPTYHSSNKQLICNGIIFDEVDGLGMSYQGNQNDPNKFKIGTLVQPSQRKNPYGDGVQTSRAVARALYADRSPPKSAGEALLTLPKTLVAGLEQFGDRGWYQFVHEGDFYIQWETWLKANAALEVAGKALHTYFYDKIPEDASAVDAIAAYRAWLRTTLGRRLAVTGKGYLAWVPHNKDLGEEEQTKRGDVFAIFGGCCKPIILRRSGAAYQVVGEGYVHGFMDGEMKGMVDRGEYQIQEITLC